MSEPANRRGLGRGLSSLIPDAPPPPSAEQQEGRAPAQQAPIELLRRNPDQPRKHFSEEELESLAASIRERGVLQPVLVRPAPGAPGEYQIVAGERRWRASQRAGLRTIPIVVREDLDDIDILEIGVIENVQRENLRPLEEAQAYRTLMDRFGRTQDEISKTVGKSRSHVANVLRLLTLPAAVQSLLDEGALSAGHARTLIGSPDAERFAKIIVEKGLSVRQAEALGKDRGPSARAPGPRPPEKTPDVAALETDLSEALGLKVTLADHNGRGEIRIIYGSLEQLDDVCRRLTAG